MFRWSRKTYREAARLARVLRNYGDDYMPIPEPVKHYKALWDSYFAKHWLDGEPISGSLHTRLEIHKHGIPF